jgi:hypothetical protein
MPEIGALMDEQWTPVLRNLSESYETRLVLDLMSGSARTYRTFSRRCSTARNWARST